MESILTSIKAMFGINEDVDFHDMVLIIHINAAIASLFLLGMQSADKFSITGDSETWDDLLAGENNLDYVKQYVFIRCKLMFDPPAHSFVISSYDDQLKKLEFHINAATDKMVVGTPPVEDEED